MSRALRAKKESPGTLERDSARQSAELAALRRMLVASQGCFSLSFVVCNDRTLRDELVEKLCREFPGIVPVTLPPQIADVYQSVRERLTDTRPAAVFVLDLEASIPSQAESQPVLRALNSSRELWEGLSCPVVFWLAEYAVTLLAAKAPDFWRYRSHQFEFVAESRPLAEIISEPLPGFEMVDALPFEEKRFRIAELEQRLDQAGPQPSPGLLPHVLGWMYELAYLYSQAGQFDRAHGLLERALQLAESGFGSDNPHMAAALNNLAELLRTANRLAEAEPLFRRALAIDEASYGPDHPEVATDLNNLALLLRATNRLAEAEPLFRRALAIDEASYGSDHPYVAVTLNNLAALLQDTNRLAEAEPLFRRALAINETCYGPKHPRVAITLNNLALLLEATNRLTEAQLLYQRALTLIVASLGLEHPNTVIIQKNYLHLLHKMGKTEEEIQAAIHQPCAAQATSAEEDR